jgi:hypothetical protein
MAAAGAPVVQVVADALLREDFRQRVRMPAVLPRAGARHQPDFAARELLEDPRVAQVREVVDGIVEVEVVVEHAAHEALQVVDA